MSRNGTLDYFFKNKGNKLSIKQKIKMVDKKAIAPIELSDDEDIKFLETSVINRSDCSDSSHTTEPYSLDSFSATPSKRTPTKISPTIYRSPTSKSKYFSPIKKRSLSLKESPSKVKRNIVNALMEAGNHNRDIYQENEFLNYTEGLDDNTKFLLTIIYQFLKDDSLKLLLQEKSTALLVKSLDVKKPGMRIVCRLFWRHGIWYRHDNIKKIAVNKSDIDNSTMNEVLSSLVDNGFLNASDREHELSYDDLVNLLKLSELLEICKSFKLKVQKKEEAKHALKNFSNQKMNMTCFLTGVSNSNNKNRVLNALSLKVGGCYKLSDLARTTLKELYILMYLGMNYSIIRENQLELALLNEKSKRECYPVHKDVQVDSANVVFKGRQEFGRYLKAHAIYEDFLATTETNLKCDIVKQVHNLYNDIDKELMASYISKPDWLLRFTPPHFYIKILAEGIQYLKRDKIQDNVNLAVNILTTLIEQNSFRQHKKSEWYSEKALILDKLLLSPDLAASVLLEAFQADLQEEYKEILKVRAQLLANRKTNAIAPTVKDKLLPYLENNDIKEKNIKATHIYKVPMCSTGRGKVKFERRTAEGVEVLDAEDYCIRHYIEEGKYTNGQHWEGRIVTTIFFLLFWDIIYTPIRGLRGIFLSHYQMYPLDMFTESFYRNRKTLIEEKLKEIEESSVEDLLEKIESTWKNRPENELSGVDRSTSWAQVRVVVRCLGALRSAALCRRLAKDYSRTHSGFPDLTVWNERTGQITFVEVKTDTDKPSIKQIQWMHYMKQHDIETEFCYVGVNTTRCKARNCDD